MISIASGDEAGRRLRELSMQLPLFNRQVGARLELKDVDLDCLDLINAHGPLTASALARRAGLHLAAITCILDRLERGGWISRDRDPPDRRAVQIRARRDRNAELLGLFAGMNTSLEQICADYKDADLELLADFLGKTAEAGLAVAVVERDAVACLVTHRSGRRARAGCQVRGVVTGFGNR